MITLDQERIIYRFIILSICKDKKISRVINDQLSLSIFLRYVNKSTLLPDGKTVLDFLTKQLIVEEVTFQHVQLNMDRFKFLATKAKIKYGDMSKYITKARHDLEDEKLKSINKKIVTVSNKEKRAKNKNVLLQIDQLFSNLSTQSESNSLDKRFLLPDSE